MKQIGYYKSCPLDASSNDYATSLETVFASLGTELVELEDWNCCGASSAHATSELLGHTLPARNLALAEAQGLTTLMAPCSACYARLLSSAEKIRKDDEAAAEINEILEPLNYKGTVQVKNILEILWDEVGPDKILHAKQKDLQGMKVACYYGCYLTRLPGIACSDDRENPQAMERLLRLVGAEPVDWPYKTDCCGAGFQAVDNLMSVQLCEKMYDMAAKIGAEAIVATCPLCQTNMDMNQDWLKREKGISYNIPVFYITDLLGLAFRSDLGWSHWRKHFVNPNPLFKQYSLR